MVRSLGYAIVRSLRRVKLKVELRWMATKGGRDGRHSRWTLPLGLLRCALPRNERFALFDQHDTLASRETRGGRHEVGCGRWCGTVDAWIAELVPGPGQSL